MLKHALLLAAFVPATGLGGCAGTQNRGLESVHQPVVSRADYAFDVNAGPDGLAAGESQRLSGWLASINLGYGDRVTVDDPSGDPSVRDGVAAQLAQRGMLLSDDVPVTGSPLTPGTVRVVVSRMRAGVPGCPDHSNGSGTDFEGNTGTNHGCAINANLAAMIANPGDLVHGQPGTGTYDPVLGSKAIESYRKAAPSGSGGLKAQSTGGN